MWILLVGMLPFALGIAFYFRRYFKKMAACFNIDTSTSLAKIILWVLPLGLGAFCINPLRFGAIAVLHIFVLAVFTELLGLLFKGVLKGKARAVWGKIQDSGALPLVLAAALMIGGYFNMHSIARTDYTLYTDKAVGEGYRVVLIADVHYGVSIDEKELAEKCSEISALEADLVVLCGDIVDSSTSKGGLYTVFESLGQIESKKGVFYVYGNHDRARRHGGEYSDSELKDAIEKSGITILRDRVYEVDDSLVLVGREDRGYTGEGNRKSVAELMEGVDKSRFVLTLDHQPTQYDEIAKSPTDLLLSGHTHGGQLWPMNIVFDVFGINDYVYGQTQIDRDTCAIVTSGFAGWSYPVKTAAPAEYVVIDIKQDYTP